VRLGQSSSLSSLRSYGDDYSLGRTTQTGIIRAGGRLYAQSPVEGFTREEMLQEAKIRQEHNKQRSKLKQLLQAASGPGDTVSIEDLMLSAKIAKMALPEEILFKSPYAKKFTQTRDSSTGAPKDIRWKSFYHSIDYPKLTAEADRLSRRKLRPQTAAVVKQEGRVEVAEEVPTGPSDQEIRRAHRILKQHMETRFTQIHKAFRTIDEDKTGTVSRKELRAIIMAFNLNMEIEVINALIDLADYDGDGNINYAEFARLMTADDILAMKNTLQAAGGATGVVKRGQPKPKRAPVFQLTPGGPTGDELQHGQRLLRERITTKYTYLTDAFRGIDSDHSGRLGVGELKQLCIELNLHLDDKVLHGLLQLADQDGDHTISYAEFARILSADDVLTLAPKH